MKSREARERWQVEARRRVRQLEAKGVAEPRLVARPHATDPDWSFATLGLEEVAWSKQEGAGELVQAVAVLEGELEVEVGDAVHWAGRPGVEGAAARSARSARIARIEHRLGGIRRTLSAGPGGRRGHTNKQVALKVS